jgi:uncharacterized protein YbjT (DUF2867 family)
LDLIAITGATGYIGGRLLRALEEAGAPVVCLARRPEHLRGRAGPRTQVLQADLLQPAGLKEALHGVDVAYYLIHSMGARHGDFEEQDRAAAGNFGAAARAAGVRRIIYLGGLAPEGASLSAHLRSRHEVGEILRGSGVETIELRASIVLGAGSLSFELVRALVERLPFMIVPRWTRVEAQPIAVSDLIAYLLEAATLPGAGSRVVEIGGADLCSYEGLMKEYARQRGLKRPMLRVPVITPWLSSLWLGLVTPLYARVGRKLIESIRSPSVVRDSGPAGAFAVRPIGVEQAIRRALQDEERERVTTHWYDAVSSSGNPRSWAGVRFGNRLADARSRRLSASPERAFAAIQSIGGTQGYYAWNGLWRLRGALDLLLGGVGMRRGRAHPTRLRVGDALDFWRVEAFEPGRRLRLAAEMRLPGRAWLEFEVLPDGAGSLIRQTAVFDPVGALGNLYWYFVFPLHALVFRGMLRGIARAAESPSP